jgi:hypothetical protein
MVRAIRFHKFCKKNGLDLLNGTNEFLKATPKPKKLKKKLKRFKKKWRGEPMRYKFIPRAADVSKENQIKSLQKQYFTVPRTPKIQQPLKVDIQKMMAMYEIDEATARSFV